MGRSSPSGAARHLPINGEELPLRRCAPPPHKWGGAAPAAQPLRRLRRHLPMNGEELPLRRCPSGAAPPSAKPTPPHEWGGAAPPALPLRRSPSVGYAATSP